MGIMCSGLAGGEKGHRDGGEKGHRDRGEEGCEMRSSVFLFSSGTVKVK